ncbi:MAG: hypothetical protein JO235_00075 [Chroococcidiopsidaceae cyanobacterium CP_BM_RX_35]|nr:hypothetical protein [Chroococcidiopsidaceae cyanobacterium CP_BM_RX_35]
MLLDCFSNYSRKLPEAAPATQERKLNSTLFLVAQVIRAMQTSLNHSAQRLPAFGQQNALLEHSLPCIISPKLN